MSNCTNIGCSNGWIHIQHPGKPVGVIIYSVPCKVCNLEERREPDNTTFEIKYTGKEESESSNIQ